MAELATPPVRWRHRRTSDIIRQYGDGQSGSSIRVPAYALRDLLNGYQHAA
jgi:hypothetical protein